MGSASQAEEKDMKCVIWKTGSVRASTVETEIKLGSDRLLVYVEAEVCHNAGVSGSA